MAVSAINRAPGGTARDGGPRWPLSIFCNPPLRWSASARIPAPAKRGRPPLSAGQIVPPERYRSGHNGADSKSDGRVIPARGFESHPVRHVLSGHAHVTDLAEKERP